MSGKTVDRDGWLLLAAAVARGTKDPSERQKWRDWAIDHLRTPPPTAAHKGRRSGFADIFNERRNRWQRKGNRDESDTG